MTTSIFDLPTTGVLTGLQLVQDLNTIFAALSTNSAGPTAPSNPVQYQLWYNTTTGQMNIFNGTAWVPTTFGAPLSGVQIISGATTVSSTQFGALLEAQGASSYTLTFPDASSYPNINIAVFSNINANSPLALASNGGSFVGTGFSGQNASLPYGMWAILVSDGYNWLTLSTAGFALLGGSSSQVFNVANATASTNALPLGQAQSTFAGINGNSTEPFAAANATAPQDVTPLGQAQSLFGQLATANTWSGQQTFASGVTFSPNAGTISAGSIPSGATQAYMQAAFSSAYNNLIESYYNNGTQVYSLNANGDITAIGITTQNAAFSSSCTVPGGTANDDAVAYQQLTNGSVAASFSSVSAPTVSGSTVDSGTISGTTIYGGTATVGTLSANAIAGGSATFSGNISAASAAFQSLQFNTINANDVYGSLVSGGTVSGNTISGGTISGSTILAGSVNTNTATLSGTLTQTPGAGADNETPLLNFSDVFSDFVVSGLLTAVPSPASLTGTLASGTAYVLGQRVVLQNPVNYTYAASSDTYVDLSNAGVLTYSAVANGSTAPAVASNSLRLEQVVTSSTAITSVVPIALQGSPHIKFRAYANNTDALSSETFNVVILDTVTYNPQNQPILQSNGSLIPTRPGYYQVSFNATVANDNSTNTVCSLYKNGAEEIRGSEGASVYTSGGSGLVYCNGTTDYLQIMVYVASATNTTGGSKAQSFVSLVGPF